ncbi:hypothetical protein LUZ63_016514 [Rhynchospora breviuscula]|uniref:BURP domain-containing protein n=1 Tax=Rhynchospora breviuscula TaxID=2022672 RepID=A0A9P9ZA19_9POAL|nr:hypothetical protein LUZ63_016514 [Rhynchospora breviuscula]
MTPLLIFCIIMIFTSAHADSSKSSIWNEWHAMLPNTPMPDIIKELIKTDELGHMSAGNFPNPFEVRAYPVIYHGNADHLSVDDVRQLFLEKDMKPGAVMKEVTLARTVGGSSFLSLEEADSIPFSSAQLPQILDRLAVVPGSTEANHIEDTLRGTEASYSRGWIKFCATSLESMINFVISEFGNHDLKVITTTFHGKDEQQKTTYTIATEGKELPEEKLVACHPQPYPYTIYNCHVLHKKGAKAYRVPLVRKDGTIVSATVVCHFDTSKWNPNFLPFIFQELKVKPETNPGICHFLPKDHLLWTLNNDKLLLY